MTMSSEERKEYILFTIGDKKVIMTIFSIMMKHQLSLFLVWFRK
jgi:hypothetical protein